jgi:hypothetical protein
VFIGFLVALQIVAMLLPADANPVEPASRRSGPFWP